MHDVVVIGGGPNGLVAAARLARRGLSTLVLERRPVTGGAAASGEIAPGFHVPTLAHAIGRLHPSVTRALKLDKTGGAPLTFVTPDPTLTSLGANGEAVVFHRDAVLTAGSIHRVSPRDAGRWREFLDTAQRIGSIMAEVAARPAPSLDGLSTRERWQWLRTGRRARKLGARHLARLMRWTTMSIADVSAEWFDHDLVRGAIAAHAIFGHFAGPMSPGTGGMWLQRLADDPHPIGSGMTLVGGPAALARALAHAAEQAGARIRTDARVAKILTREGGVVGVVLEDGEQIGARAVLSAVDPRQTFLSMIDPADVPPTFLARVRHIRARGVTAKINLALSALPAFSAFETDALPLRGRVLIAPGIEYLERAFDAAKYGRISPAPWLEIAMPSVLDPSLAPAGAHVMSIVVHFAPHTLAGGDWTTARETLATTALDVLRPHAPGIDALIVAKEIVTPEDLERDWGFTGGHIFHGERTLDQSWVARPILGWARYRTPIDRLYLGSAGTHPGGSITGLSGLLAGNRLGDELPKRRPSD